MRRLVSILLALSGTACATVQNGPLQRIHVDSEPAGAQVDLRGCGAGASRGGTTPGVVWVNRRAKTCTLVLRAEGYREEMVLLRRGTSERIEDNFVLPNAMCDTVSDCDSLSDLLVVGTVSALLIGTGIGLDAATGAMFEQQPSQVSVALRPAETPGPERSAP